MLVWLLCLFFTEVAFAGAWVQEKGKFSFDHSFSRYYGSKNFARDNTKKLESLITRIDYLKSEEERRSIIKYNEHRSKARRLTRPLAKEMRDKYLDDNHYWDKKQQRLVEMLKDDEKRKDIFRQLLYKTVPRFHYNATLEYGVTTNGTIGCKFMYDRFESSFLKKLSFFALDSYWRVQLLEFDSKVFSVQPYIRAKYCDDLEYGFGMDLLLGYGKPTKKNFGRIKVRKIFRNHSVGFYYPLSEPTAKNTIEFRTENTIGKELDFGLGFYIQHFWNYSVSSDNLATHASCHRAQSCVYKAIHDKCTLNIGIFIENTKFYDIEGMIDPKRFPTTKRFVPSYSVLRSIHKSIKRDIANKSLLQVFNLGINGSISWSF